MSPLSRPFRIFLFICRRLAEYSDGWTFLAFTIYHCYRYSSSRRLCATSCECVWLYQRHLANACEYTSGILRVPAHRASTGIHYRVSAWTDGYISDRLDSFNAIHRVSYETDNNNNRLSKQQHYSNNGDCSRMSNNDTNNNKKTT